MGNVVEGLLGAILEDSRYNVDTCRGIYNKHILPHFDKYCLGPHEESQNPKDQLVKIMSVRKCQHFEIRRDDLDPKSGEFEATGRFLQQTSRAHTDKSVVLHDTEVGKGSGPWQALAVRRACTDVMRKIRQDGEWVDTMCYCRSKGSA